MGATPRALLGRLQAGFVGLHVIASCVAGFWLDEVPCSLRPASASAPGAPVQATVSITLRYCLNPTRRSAGALPDADLALGDRGEGGEGHIGNGPPWDSIDRNCKSQERRGAPPRQSTDNTPAGICDGRVLVALRWLYST